MSGFEPKTARIIAWVIFITACLLVVVALAWFLKDGFGPALESLKGFGANLRAVAIGIWNGVAKGLTIAIDTALGGFTGNDFQNTTYGGEIIGHWMLIGVLFIGFVAFCFFLMFFKK